MMYLQSTGQSKIKCYHDWPRMSLGNILSIVPHTTPWCKRTFKKVATENADSGANLGYERHTHVPQRSFSHILRGPSRPLCYLGSCEQRHGGNAVSTLGHGVGGAADNSVSLSAGQV
ncbi:hypothetical protein V2G26_013731 [Clonostachys chloroleuca]